MMPTRHVLRAAVKKQYAVLQALGVETHPDKTVIGNAAKGFDFLGFHCCPTGMRVSDEALSRRDRKIARLYEQGASKRRIGQYLVRWLGWAICGTASCGANATLAQCPITYQSPTTVDGLCGGTFGNGDGQAESTGFDWISGPCSIGARGGGYVDVIGAATGPVYFSTTSSSSDPADCTQETTSYALSPSWGFPSPGNYEYGCEKVIGSSGGTIYFKRKYDSGGQGGQYWEYTDNALWGVTITQAVGGTISCTSPIDYNGAATCTATPDPGYSAGSWGGGNCSGSAGSSCTLSNVTTFLPVSATFSELTASSTGIQTLASGVTADLNIAGCSQVTAASFTAAPASASLSFPYGLLGFTATGCGSSATISVTYSHLASGGSFYKCANSSCSAFAATINGNTVTYTVTDNGSGDSDSTLGTITDPSGIGFASGGASVPTLTDRGLILLSGLLALTAAFALRRRYQ